MNVEEEEEQLMSNFATAGTSGDGGEPNNIDPVQVIIWATRLSVNSCSDVVPVTIGHLILRPLLRNSHHRAH